MPIFPDLNPLDSGVTEMIDIEVTRQDGVESPASGIPFLVMKAVSRGKRDETPDIAGADDVICLLAKLIASEASELAAGYLEETSDISLLMEAMGLMKWFRENEQWGAEMDSATMKSAASDSSPAGRKAFVAAAGRLMANKTKEPGVANEPTATAQKDTPTVPETPATPVEGDASVEKSVDEKIADAVAKVEKAAEDRVSAIKAELDALKATPVPGVVALTAPPAAREGKRTEDQLMKAAYHDRQAEIVGDRDLVRYHRDKAAALRSAVGD